MGLNRYYLRPPALRRGSPCLVFVSKHGARHELGVFHELTNPESGKPKQGKGSEYNQMSAFRISKDLYEALKRESVDNNNKYR